MHAFAKWLILLYRRFIRRRLNRVCMYKVSCSEYALQALAEKQPFLSTVFRIKHRVFGCSIRSVEVSRDGAWHLVNAH